MPRIRPKEQPMHSTPNTETTITVQINGEPQTLPTKSTIRELMERLDYAQTGGAVAINLTFVPTDRYDSTYIQPDDTIDILGAIYGG